MNTKPTHTSIRPALALVPLVSLLAMLFFVINAFGSDSLSGASQISLIMASAIATALALWQGVTWGTIESSISKQILNVAPAIITLLLIGALSGIWMTSGIVPTLIYYGVQLIDPSIFLASTCVICAFISLMTGSSWTTIATIGIALMGIGEAQGYSTGWTAGAVISGSYFGDKISPLSETTILASSSSETPLFEHIRYMLVTTIPSLVIALTIFGLTGMNHDIQNSIASIQLYTETLQQTFNISPWLLSVPILTGILIAKRVPSIITLFLSMFMAIIAAVISQPHNLEAIAQEISLEANIPQTIKGAIISLYGATAIDSGVESINNLISTRGMGGMLNTIWLIICAVTFGGVMTGSGMLNSLTNVFITTIRRRFSLVGSTVLSGLFLNICTADQYISIILTSNMFKDVYQRNGFETRLLSRTTEDAVTVTSVLIPWNTCGLTQATVLGVSTWTYLPYCFFNLISPLMSLFIAAIGYKIKQHRIINHTIHN